MTGLSTELYRRCRNVLLQCGEFDSNAALRAVFVTAELRPFQTGLPEAANKGERVDLCLNFLLSRQLSDGRSVLILFITALRDRYAPGDALRDELDTLAQDVTQALGTPTSQTVKPVSSFQQVKIKTLEKRLADLMTDYEAANKQLSQVLSEVDRTRLCRQVDTLEQEINQLEAELKTLR